VVLSDYLKKVQILLSDLSETNYNRADLIDYINEGRSQIAGEGQCVRAIPFTGSVNYVLNSTNGSGGTVGSGYPLVFTNAVGDTTGSGAAGTYDVMSDGTITNIVQTNAGTNYSKAPIVTCGGAGFSGGTAPSLLAIMYTGFPAVVNQEVYPFSDVSWSNQPGISGIIGVRGVSVIWNTYRFTTQRVSFSKYQAWVRTYTNTFTDVPRVAAQYGQGVNGSLYLYPVPNSNYILEWDCICDVSPLTDDTITDPIPAPWTTAVQYYAAYKAFESAQALDRADKMFQTFQRFMKRARAQTQPGTVSNWYGRA
jgi:hypothetical protein